MDYPYETLRLECGCYETQTGPGAGATFVCAKHREGKHGDDIFDAVIAAIAICRTAGVVLLRSTDRKPGGPGESWRYPEAHPK